MDNDFQDYTDEELAKKWNHLETCRFSPYVETQMDEIEEILKDRRVIAWDQNGNITQKESQ